MSLPHILVIEDDTDISELVQFNLERSGFSAEVASDGEKGVALAIKNFPALIVLDLMLPGISGLQVCKRIRENPKTKLIPIVILSAKGEESDIVSGLELGADDYISKPFSPTELIARIKAVLRRATLVRTNPEIIEVPPLTIDMGRHEVLVDGKPLSFTLAEFNLVKTLASKPGRVFTRDQLLEKISGGETYLLDRNVDVHVRSIRKKLGDHADLIVTIRGVGYKCKD